jgi:hypothetical protein
MREIKFPKSWRSEWGQLDKIKIEIKNNVHKGGHKPPFPMPTLFSQPLAAKSLVKKTLQASLAE